MKVLLLVLVILGIFLEQSVCQEVEVDPDSPAGLWNKLKGLFKDFVNSLRGMWEQLKSEVMTRSADMGDWTRTMFEEFKNKMYEWINTSSSPEDEKNDMRNYIERLEMVPETPNLGLGPETSSSSEELE